MIIYTNEGNPLALKLLICANVAGSKDVAIKNVNFTGDNIYIFLTLT